MREIKFRAWDKLKNRMMTSISVIHFDQSKDCIEQVYGYNPRTENTSSADWASLENVIVMQYTGLKDKNGVEIYEGDILATWEGEELGWCISGIVNWWNDEAKFCLDNKDGYSSDDENWDIPSEWKGYEILGNIYQNKELIKNEKEN